MSSSSLFMNTGDEQRLKELLKRWQDNTLPPSLVDELQALLQKSDADTLLRDEMKKAWEKTESEEVFDATEKEAMLASIVSHRKERRFTFHYAAAAVLLSAVLISTLLWQQPDKKEKLSVQETGAPLPAADVAAPTSNKAILTLSDGRQIIIENMGDGNLAKDGNMNVVKRNDDQLVYSGNAGEMKWNTLTVPKGSKPIQLTLADGSGVTLNAASSLTYPTAFTASKRNVTMTGEAFFEVAHVPSADASTGNRPFVVSVNNLSIEVVGTKFNVNAYDDEKNIKVTLLEGAVRLKTNEENQILKPGEQAQVSGNISILKNVDVEMILRI